MKSAITRALARAQSENRAAFIPYVTGGFPDDEACLELIRALGQAGADVIEVGIPFSDPLADGPTIQASSQIALTNGATPRGVLDLVAKVEEDVRAPLVIMTYCNPIMQMGEEAFAHAAAQAGVAGVIVPDLPPEEAGAWIEAARTAGVDTIFMATPPTPPERLALLNQVCRGFLYYVPITGVTGSGLEIDDDMLAAIARVREASDLPVAVGFGVAEPEQAAALAHEADGVIVGSALVGTVLTAEDAGEGVAAAQTLARSIKATLAR